MNTITLDNATYNEMSTFASLNNVSISEMLRDYWHDFMEYAKTKKTAQKLSARDQEFLNRFRGNEWQNDKTPAELAEEYHKSRYSDPNKKIIW